MKTKLPKGFSSPTALPTDQGGPEWQRENRAWGEANPMRYDWKAPLGVEEFSREVPDAATRLITNACGQGSFLITTIRKP